jgi:hypothetical protein
MSCAMRNTWPWAAKSEYTRAIAVGSVLRTVHIFLRLHKVGISTSDWAIPDRTRKKGRGTETCVNETKANVTGKGGVGGRVVNSRDWQAARHSRDSVTT